MQLLNYMLSFMYLFVPISVSAVTLVSPEADISITTQKVATIENTILSSTYQRFAKQMTATRHLPGPRVIIINSPGGLLDEGEKIIHLIRAEQATGVKVICYVDKDASSMAFNILTRCDVRLSSPHATMLVHKIRYVGKLKGVMTSKNLREYANQLDQDDEPYRQANAKAMGLSLQDYDQFADKETTWTAATLRKRGYLHGFATLKK